MRTTAVILVLLGLLPLSAASWAQPSPEPEETSRTVARKLGYDGIEAYNAGDFVLASERLEAAYTLLRVPSLALWSARALSKLGRLVEASDRYGVIATLPLPEVGREVHELSLRDAAEERALLLLRIPVLTVEVKGWPSDAVATLDGRPLPPASMGTELPVDPGPHRIELASQGRSVQRDVVLREGDKVRVELELPAAPPSSSSPPFAPRTSAAPRPSAGPRAEMEALPTNGFRVAGWVGLGLGTAGLLVGAVAGGLAVGQNADLDQVCVDDVCPPSAQGDVDSYDATRALSTIGFVVGAVALTAGVVLVLVPPSVGSPDGRAAVEARMGPTSAVVCGAF